MRAMENRTNRAAETLRTKEAEARDLMVRDLVAEAIRRALEEGVRQAEDPIAYLRNATGEMNQLLELAAATGVEDASGLRAMLSEEIQAAARDLTDRFLN